MNRIILVMIISLLQNVFVFSQNTCECDTILKQVIQKVETEYPGFNEKTKDIISYTSIKNVLLDSVKTATIRKCQQYLEQYCRYF